MNIKNIFIVYIGLFILNKKIYTQTYPDYTFSDPYFLSYFSYNPNPLNPATTSFSFDRNVYNLAIGDFNSAAIYNERLAFLATKNNNFLVYNTNLPYKNGINPYYGPYFILNVGQKSQFYGEEPNSNLKITNVNVYKYRTTPSDNGMAHVAYVSNSINSKSYIHHFTYEYAKSVSSIFFHGSMDIASGGYNYFAADQSSGTNIQKVVISRVYDEASSKQPTNVRSNGTYPCAYNTKHNIWAVGQGILKYFDGYYWVDFSSKPDTIYTKSISSLGFYSYKNQNINVGIDTLPNKLYKALFVSKDATTIWVAGADMTILKITQNGGGTGAGFTNINNRNSFIFYKQTGVGYVANPGETITSIYFSSNPDNTISNNGWFTTDAGRIFKTINGGATWTIDYVKGTTTQSFNKILPIVNDDSKIWAFGNNYNDRVNLIENINSTPNIWNNETSFNKIFDIENNSANSNKYSFNDGDFYKGATDSLGFFVGAGQLIVKIPDTLFNFSNATTTSNSSQINFVVKDTLDFYPSILNNIPLNKKFVQIRSNREWSKQNSDYIKITLEETSVGVANPGYRYPLSTCIGSNDSKLLLPINCPAESYIDPKISTNLTNGAKIPNYPIYNNSVNNNIYSYTPLLNAWAKQFTSNAILDITMPINNNSTYFKLFYEPLNYNFSLDLTSINVPILSVAYPQKTLTILQKGFIPSFQQNTTQILTNNNNAVNNSIDSFTVSPVGGISVNSFPSSYYDIKIDGLNKNTDTPILRKSYLQQFVVKTISPNVYQFGGVTDTISITSKYNYINSNPTASNYDSVIVNMIAPCRADGSNCGGGVLPSKSAIVKKALLLGVVNTRNLNNTQTEKSYKLNYTSLIPATDNAYNDYTNKINDSVLFCVNGRLKNLDPATQVASPCLDSTDNTSFTSVFAQINLKYKVYPKYFISNNPIYNLNTNNTIRYRYKMLPNPNLVKGLPSVKTTATNTDWTSIDTLYSKDCIDTGSGNTNSKMICNVLDTINMPFIIKSDIVNNLSINRIDTLAIEVEGYDNAILSNGSKDTSIKKRIVKLIKLVHEPSIVKIMYKSINGITAADTIDNSLPLNTDDTLIFKSEVSATNIDSLYIKSNCKWKFTPILPATVLPDWIDTIRRSSSLNKDSGIYYSPYNKLVFIAKKPNPNIVIRKDSMLICNIQEFACKKIYLIQKPAQIDLFLFDTTKKDNSTTDKFDLGINTNGYLLDTAYKIANLKFKNIAKNYTLDTAAYMRLYIKTTSNWELKFIDSTENGTLLAKIFDTINLRKPSMDSIFNANPNKIVGKGNSIIQFISIDSNHTKKLWKQKVSVNLIGNSFIGSIFYLIKDTLKQITLDFATTKDINGNYQDKAKNNILFNGKNILPKIFPFTNKSIDSLNVIMDSSINYWDIKLPKWLIRNKTLEKTNQADSGSKKIYFTLTDSNYTKTFKIDSIQICKSFDRNRTNYTNAKDSFCNIFYVAQDTASIKKQFITQEDINADSMIFRASIGDIDSVQINTRGFYTIKDLKSAFTIIEPSGTNVIKISPNEWLNTGTYTNDSVGYSKIYFRTKTALLSGQPVKADLFAVCLTSTNICDTIKIEQYPPRLLIKYFRKDKYPNQQNVFNDTVLLNYTQNSIDTALIDYASNYDIKVYNGTSWILGDATLSNSNSIGLDRKVKNVNNNAIDTLYLKNKLPDNLSLNRLPTDSLLICPQGSTIGCQLLKYQVDTPKIALIFLNPNNLRAGIKIDTLLLKSNKDYIDSINVISNGKWYWQFKGSGTWANATFPIILTNLANYSFVDSITTTKDNFKNKTVNFKTNNNNLTGNIILDSIRTCIVGIDNNSQLALQNKYCKILKIKQDTVTFFITTNQPNNDTLYYSYLNNQKDSVKINSNSIWEWQYGEPSWAAGISTKYDTSLTNQPNANNKMVTFVSKNPNNGNTILYDSVRVCIIGVTAAQQAKYCKVVKLKQDTAKLLVDFTINKSRVRGDTIILGFITGNEDSLRITSNNNFSIASLGTNGTVNWADINQAKTNIKLTGSNIGGAGSIDYITSNNGTLTFKALTNNETSIIKYATLTLTILGTTVKKQFIIMQDTPRAKFLDKVVYLGRRPLEKQALINISANAGWKLKSSNNYSYLISQINGLSLFNNYSFNVNNYDSSNATLKIQSLKENLNFTKQKDYIYLYNPVYTRIYDSILIIQDSAYINFIYATEPNSKGMPTINQVDSSITVGPEEDIQFKVKIFSNAPWLVYNNLDTTLSTIKLENSWYQLYLPNNFNFTSDTNLLVIKTLRNELIGNPTTRSGYVYINGILGAINKNLFKLKIIQNPYIVPEAENFLIFPNPVKDRLIIKSKNYISNLNNIGYVYIYTMSGEQIAQRTFTNGVIDFDFSILSTGLYILKIYDGNIYAQKIILKE